MSGSSMHPGLQSDVDLREDVDLESPAHEPKAKGLIPRKSLFMAIGAFFIVLLIMAYIDVSQQEAKRAQDIEEAKKSKTTGGSNLATIGPAPAAMDIATVASSQQAKVPDSPASSPAVLIGIGAGKNVVPPGVNTTVGPNSGLPRVGVVSTPAVAPDRGVSDERNAMAEVSGIFAIQGESGSPVGDALRQTGLPGATLPATASDAIQRQIESLARQSDSMNPSAAADASTDRMIKAMQSLQEGSKPVVSKGKDVDWLREKAQETKASASYASRPAGAWMVFQGTRVPIVTREAVNSDLPGQLTAMATENIYDSINQCAIVIPAGTKFIGSYSSDIRPGQTRLLFGFSRMIFPDGRSVDLAGAQGVDSQGASGSEADVNNHFLKMFGYSFALAWVADRATTADGASVTTRNADGSTSTTTIAGQVLADISSRILSRNAQIPPTLSLPVGSRLFVTIVRDISLNPTSHKYCR